jgi:hypothetical protein
VRIVEFRNGYRYDALESVLSVSLIFLKFIESAFGMSEDNKTPQAFSMWRGVEV